jgi:hypothetical protein
MPILIAALNTLHLNITNTEKLELRTGGFSSGRWRGNFVFVDRRRHIEALASMVLLWVATTDVTLHRAGLRSWVHGSWNAISSLSSGFPRCTKRTGREARTASPGCGLRIRG